ncbi:12885_t:CDS:2 [Ambispora gerdemannii]|uniref:12885_t:CDS:1 n=1 Tax=Ambispora gerdemannii TaxID=144530 RepID=A0A9N8UYQ2_9GLOM|nr:12885_t:CDS:2 [Ambispora gerdemannii]
METSNSTSTSNTQSSSTLPNSAFPNLSYFCIYNPSFGLTEETQANQLLYYVAKKTVPMDMQMRQIGLAQGLVNFTKVFSPDKPCENVHSQKNRLAFYEPEPDYWIHISIELGYIKKTIKDKDSKSKSVVEFLDANLHDSNIRRMLEKGYEIYRIFNGPFSYTERTEGVKALKIKLEEFFSNWVFEWDFEKPELNKIIDGVRYQPLSTAAKSDITSFAKKIETEYPFISSTIFILWQDRLIYCGKDDAGNGSDIVDADIREIWRHLYYLPSLKSFPRVVPGGHLLSYFSVTSPTKESQKDTTTDQPSSPPPASIEKPEDTTTTPPPLLSIQSNFLTDPTTDPKGAEQRIINPKTIFLKKQIDRSRFGFKKRGSGHESDEDLNQDEEDDFEKFYLVAHNHDSLTLAFLIPVTSIEGTANIEKTEFYSSLHEYLLPQIDGVSKVIEDEIENSRKIGKSEPDKEYRFLFYNKLTLAIKCSINSSASSNNILSWTSAPKNLAISGEMAHVLCDVYEDLEKYPQLTEIYTKATSNFWVVGKRSEGRCLYLVVPKRDAPMLEVEGLNLLNDDSSFMAVT